MKRRGIPRSPETRAKQRAAALARWADPVARATLSESKRQQWAQGAYDHLRERRGERAINWRGGVVRDSAGYVYVFAPDHPHCPPASPYMRRCRLVMEKALGRYLRTDEIVHHVNRIKDDDRPENLELTTRVLHRVEHNLAGDSHVPVGSKHFRARFTEDDIRDIRTSYAAGARQVDLAARYGVNQTTISTIVRNKGWKHVT